MRQIFLVALLLLLFAVAGCQTSTAPAEQAAPPEPAATSEPTDEVSSPAPIATDQPAEPQGTEAPKRLHFGLWYVPDGETHQRLDLFLPEAGEQPYPTILAFHGGGFRSGSKAYYTKLAVHLNELGYAFAAADYRLAPRSTFPAQVEDVFCALAWVHANHETYGLDDQRIVVMGDSAGGNLAALVGTVETPERYLENCPNELPSSDWVQGAVIFYAPTDFTNPEARDPLSVAQSLEPYMGGEIEEIPAERLAEASPMRWVDGSEPPFLLIHGLADSTVASWISEEFAAELEQSGVEVELLLIPEAGHGFLLRNLSSPEMTQSLAAIEPFLSSIFGR